MPYRFTDTEIARMRGSAAYRRGRTMQDAENLAIEKGFRAGSVDYQAFLEGFQSRLDADKLSSAPAFRANRGETLGPTGNTSD